MYSIAALFSLAFAFFVLVVTFRWISRLLARRLQDMAAGDGDAEPAATPEPSSEEAADEEPDERPSGAGTIHGANFALVLGILASSLFKISPLMLVLSVAGLFYGARAAYEGIRYFQMIIYRALIGVTLSLASVGLHYLNMSGQLANLWQMLAG